MKSKKTLFVIISLIAVVLIGGYVWNDRQQPTPTSSAPTATTPADTAVPNSKTVEVTMEAGNYYFSPKNITAKKGDTIKITLTAKGMMHDFTLDEFDVSSGMVDPGESRSFSFTADKTGTFEYYCSVGSHRQSGQVGTLTVE